MPRCCRPLVKPPIFDCSAAVKKVQPEDDTDESKSKAEKTSQSKAASKHTKAQKVGLDSEPEETSANSASAPKIPKILQRIPVFRPVASGEPIPVKTQNKIQEEPSATVIAATALLKQAAQQSKTNISEKTESGASKPFQSRKKASVPNDGLPPQKFIAFSSILHLDQRASKRRKRRQKDNVEQQDAAQRELFGFANEPKKSNRQPNTSKRKTSKKKPVPEFLKRKPIVVSWSCTNSYLTGCFAHSTKYPWATFHCAYVRHSMSQYCQRI